MSSETSCRMGWPWGCFLPHATQQAGALHAADGACRTSMQSTAHHTQIYQHLHDVIIHVKPAPVAGGLAG